MPRIEASCQKMVELAIGIQDKKENGNRKKPVAKQRGSEL
jgi:hypothetical protein